MSDTDAPKTAADLSTRRTILMAAVSTTAAAATAAMIGTPLTALGSEPDAQAAMDDFVAVSAVLTGIEAAKLAPRIDPVRINREYFNRLQEKQAVNFARLLQLFRDNRALPARELGDLLLNKSGDDMRYLCRSVILMWYLGAWYEPAHLKALATSPDPERENIRFEVISAKAYSQGWVWRVAQTHPMGYSEWSFGYWRNAPPDLDTFIKSPKASG